MTIDYQTATQWGWISQPDNVAALLTQPPIKQPDSNEWFEHDGREFNLTSLVAGAPSRTLTFKRRASATDITLDPFYAHWASSPAVLVSEPWMPRPMVLQPNSVATAVASGMATLTVQATDISNPTLAYAEPPEAEGSTGWSIDGIDLRRFGFAVLKGGESELQKPGSVHAGMRRDIPGTAGLITDTGGTRHTRGATHTLPLYWRGKATEAIAAAANLVAYLMQGQRTVRSAAGTQRKLLYQQLTCTQAHCAGNIIAAKYNLILLS